MTTSRKIARARKPPVKKSKAAGNKTKPTAANVDAFIAGVPSEARRKDARTALALMKKVTGEQPKMWGPSIIGFGEYHYKYASGREGDSPMAGFSPRATSMVFYIMGGVPGTDDLLKKLGKYKMGKSCLYINRLEEVDLGVLEKIIAKSDAWMRKTYPTK